MTPPGLRILQLPHRTAVAADALALTVFVAVGTVNHDVSIWAFLRDVVIFVACWLLAGGAFDLYKRPSLRALLSTWLAAVTAGVLLRALTLWQLGADDAVFLGVALGFSLLFVLAGRTAARFVPNLD